MWCAGGSDIKTNLIVFGSVPSLVSTLGFGFHTVPGAIMKRTSSCTGKQKLAWEIAWEIAWVVLASCWLLTNCPTVAICLCLSIPSIPSCAKVRTEVLKRHWPFNLLRSLESRRTGNSLLFVRCMRLDCFLKTFWCLKRSEVLCSEEWLWGKSLTFPSSEKGSAPVPRHSQSLCPAISTIILMSLEICATNSASAITYCTETGIVWIVSSKHKIGKIVRLKQSKFRIQVTTQLLNEVRHGAKSHTVM